MDLDPVCKQNLLVKPSSKIAAICKTSAIKSQGKKTSATVNYMSLRQPGTHKHLHIVGYSQPWHVNSQKQELFATRQIVCEHKRRVRTCNLGSQMGLLCLQPFGLPQVSIQRKTLYIWGYPCHATYLQSLFNIATPSPVCVWLRKRERTGTLNWISPKCRGRRRRPLWNHSIGPKVQATPTQHDRRSKSNAPRDGECAFQIQILSAAL